MHGSNDIELLERYTRGNSETAFAEIVTRYSGLVYSSALRQVNDPHLAEDVTQAVFILLAKKAGSLKKETILSGWLYRTTLFVARDAIKSEQRRLKREQHLATMDQPLSTQDDPQWLQIAPYLDEAMAHLSDKDRNAVLLRYFEQKSFVATGSALGSNEESARKRVTRAVEKLRHFFTKRGIALPAAAIATLLSANAVQAAPSTLTTTLIAHSAGTTLVAETTLTLVKGTMKMMTWMKIKIGIATAAVLVVGATGTTFLAQQSRQRTPQMPSANLNGTRLPLQSTPILITAYFFPVTKATTNDFAFNKMKSLPGGAKIRQLADEDGKELLAKLKSKTATPVPAPRVLTYSGTPAELFVGDANGPGGLSVKVSPTLSKAGVDLDFSLSQTTIDPNHRIVAKTNAAIKASLQMPMVGHTLIYDPATPTNCVFLSVSANDRLTAVVKPASVSANDHPAAAMKRAPGHPLAWDAMMKEVTTKPLQATNQFIFWVTNTAETNVVLDHIQPSCGCTVAKLPKNPWVMTPGESGPVSATINFAGKSGELMKLLTVHSSEGQQTLTLKVHIPFDPTIMTRQQNMTKALADKQAVFKGDCASCHAEKGKGKSGEELFAADCVICHQPDGHRAEMVPDLANINKATNKEYWKYYLENGGTSLMPSFSEAKGGPLTSEEIDKFADFLSTKFPPKDEASIKPVSSQ